MEKYNTTSLKTDDDVCDVLLTYEIKNREIENLCLIKYELERRGYSVKLRMQYDTFFRHHRPIDAKLIVVPGYYRERAQFYSASHTVRTDKILNIMWEQVRNTKEENNSDSIFSIKDWGRVASHIAWGSFTRDQLINKCGCDPSHVFMTGHVTLDFLRKPLIRYYATREELLPAFDIPCDKKAHLFISSLSYADGDMRILKNSSMGATETEGLQFKQFCLDTRNELLSWFEKVLEEDENNVIIYRPHPEEKGDSRLFDLAKRQDRFFVINERSVKQWIIACDKIYTWKSTSVAEVMALGKSFNVLRPLPISAENDIGIFSNMKHISTLDEFSQVFFSEEQNIDAQLIDNIKKYYYIPENKCTYELICDAIEQIIHDDSYKIDPPFKNPLLKWYYPERMKNVLKRLIANSKLCEKYHMGNKFKNNIIGEWIDDIFYVKRKLSLNNTSEEEIAEITSRIKKALEKSC